MGNIQDIFILVTFLVEVAVLFYLEVKAWHTLYTPLIFLMIPYTIVLLITIMVAGGSFGFVEFYYPSIVIWNVGLLLFAVPSLVLGYFMSKSNMIYSKRPLPDSLSKVLVFIVFFMSLIFLVHLKGTLGSSAQALGSDEFGSDFSGGGLWGHLRIITIPLLMMCIYYVSLKRWWLAIPVGVFLMVSMLNQVKGWVIIPVISAMSMRLYTGKTKLSARLLLSVVLLSFLVFFASYGLSILVVQNRGVSKVFMDFIFGHFFHYLTSGTFGWSMDLQLGLPDDYENFQNVIAQFVNLFKSFVGDSELVAPINPIYHNPGLSLTNVRTIFGTLYINSTWPAFAIYVLFLSTFSYFLKIALMRFNNIYMYTIYFFFCGMLFMGWFDLYFAGLTIIEFPIITLMLLFVEYIFKEKSKNENCCNTD